jgi:hypothetical protein
VILSSGFISWEKTVSPQHIYIELSDKLRRLLASKKIDLQAELMRQGINTELHGLTLADRPKARDPFLVVLASGVAASLVGAAISRIVNAVSDYKRSQMTERALDVATDSQGDAIIDNQGNPVYNLMEKPVLAPLRGASTMRLVAGKLLSFDVSDEAVPKPTEQTARRRSGKSTKIRPRSVSKQPRAK